MDRVDPRRLRKRGKSERDGSLMRPWEVARLQRDRGCDSKTGFLNERGVRDEFWRRLAHLRRTGHGFGVVVVDLKNFKLLNDGAGQLKGDEVIKMVTRQMRVKGRQEDSYWRIGGDEYAWILEVKDEETLQALVFETRHDQEGAQEPGWLEQVNTEVRRNLPSILAGTELEGTNLGQAGQLRAGVCFFGTDWLAREGRLGASDWPGLVMQTAKSLLKEIKDKDKGEEKRG